MKAIAVSVNGKPLCVTGIQHGRAQVVISLQDTDKRPFCRLSLVGHDMVTRESLRWPAPAIDLGDEVTIRIVETDTAEPPHDRWIYPDS